MEEGILLLGLIIQTFELISLAIIKKVIIQSNNLMILKIIFHHIQRLCMVFGIDFTLIIIKNSVLM